MKDDDPTQKDHVRLQIRVPRELHAQLVTAAERNLRSLNGEITARLAGDPFVLALAERDRQIAELRSLSVKILDAVSK